MHAPVILSGRRCLLFARLVGNGLAQAAAAVAISLLVRYGFNHLIAGAGPDSDAGVIWVGLGLVALAAFASWLRIKERVDASRLGQAYAYEVRLLLFDRLSTLVPRLLQRRSRGGVMLRFIGDLTALRQWVSLGLARLSVGGVTAVVALVALSQLNMVLAAAAAVALAIGVATAVVVGIPMQGAVRESRRRRSNLAANVSEKIASMAVVQVFGQSGSERSRLERQAQLLQEAMISRSRITGRLRGVTEATSIAATGSVLLLGVGEVARGNATPGTVVAAMTVIHMLVPALRDLGRVHEYWQAARVATGKIEEFLGTPTLVREIPDAADLTAQSGRLEFRDVKIAGVFERLGVAAEAGSVIAIVGPNGTGKSTLLSLAARLIDPDEGTVLLDGKDVAQHSLASVRRAVGMVGPDLPLLRGTIEKNLTYRWPEAPAAEVARISALCELDKLMSELPEGLKTRLSDGGGNLSIGQRQRIALARALLGDPVILLLDEAEANLDAHAAAVFDRVLGAYRGTVLMVTHRLDRLASVDAIWHLANGRLVEAGPPVRLLAGDGPTSRLFRVDRTIRLEQTRSA